LSSSSMYPMAKRRDRIWKKAGKLKKGGKIQSSGRLIIQISDNVKRTKR
jgi:hypothetical protein